MRILRVLNELRPSGVEATLRASAPSWSALGVQLEILSIGTTPGPYASALREAGYPIHHIPLQPVAHFVPTYIKLLRSAGYDVVHVHPERANFYTTGLAKAAGVKRVVRSIHNVFEFRGPLRLQRRLQRRLLTAAGVTHLSVSSSVQEVEWSNFRNPSKVVYNSYDDRRFLPLDDQGRQTAREALGIAGDEFVVTSVGNCSRAKNHTALLEALTEVRLPRKLRYIHAGIEQPGNPEQVMARELGLADVAEFRGNVADVPPILQVTDCFVMPSIYEGLGNAALEAMGCGVPTVLSDVPGLRDLRTYFDTVWWTTPEPAPLAKAIQQVADLSEQERRQVRTRASTTAQAHFSIQRGVDEYLRVYEGGG